MRNKLLACLFLGIFTSAVHSVAIVVPIAAAKAVAATGATSSISGLVNLVGIALSAIVFSSSGKNYKIGLPSSSPIEGSTVTSTAPLSSLPSGAGIKCGNWRTTYHGTNANGQTCSTVTVQVGSSSETVCTTAPAADLHSNNGSCVGASAVPFVHRYFKRVDGSSVGYVSDSFVFGYSPLDSTTTDNQVEIKLSSNAYAPPSDADLTPGVGGASGIPAFTSNGDMYLQGMDSQGLLTVTKIDPSESGVSIQEYSQVSQGQVRQTNATIASNGVVQSTNQNYYQGEVQNIPASSGQFVPDFAPVLNPTQNPAPDGSTNPGTGGSVTVEFPTDYARAGEAALAAQNLADALLAGEVVTPEVPDTEMPWFGTTFDGVLPTINTSGATCPVWQFDALGESFYIDHHCQLIVDFNAFFYAIFTAFWTLLAFRTVLEA